MPGVQMLLLICLLHILFLSEQKKRCILWLGFYFIIYLMIE